MHFFPHEFGAYGIPIWLAFGVIALGVAWLFSKWCIPIGHLVVAAAVFWLDCASVWKRGPSLAALRGFAPSREPIIPFPYLVTGTVPRKCFR